MTAPTPPELEVVHLSQLEVVFYLLFDPEDRKYEKVWEGHVKTLNKMNIASFNTAKWDSLSEPPRQIRKLEPSSDLQVEATSSDSQVEVASSDLSHIDNNKIFFYCVAGNLDNIPKNFPENHDDVIVEPSAIEALRPRIFKRLYERALTNYVSEKSDNLGDSLGHCIKILLQATSLKITQPSVEYSRYEVMNTSLQLFPKIPSPYVDSEWRIFTLADADEKDRAKRFLYSLVMNIAVISLDNCGVFTQTIDPAPHQLWRITKNGNELGIRECHSDENSQSFSTSIISLLKRCFTSEKKALKGRLDTFELNYRQWYEYTSRVWPEFSNHILGMNEISNISFRHWFWTRNSISDHHNIAAIANE